LSRWLLISQAKLEESIPPICFSFFPSLFSFAYRWQCAFAAVLKEHLPLGFFLIYSTCYLAFALVVAPFFML
jgi:hypothetical protein